MPLPFLLIGACALRAGVVAHNVVKIKEAKETVKFAKECYAEDKERLEKENNSTIKSLSKLQDLEKQVIKSFNDFTNVFEKIKNRPKFAELHKKDIKLPEFNLEEIKDFSIGSYAVLGFLGSSITGLVGDIVFSFVGKKVSDKAEEILTQVVDLEKKINEACKYLSSLKRIANKFYKSIDNVYRIYQEHLVKLSVIVEERGHVNWKTFTEEEKLITENTVLLVGGLYDMCKVELLVKNKDGGERSTINSKTINESIRKADTVISKVAA